MPFHVLRRSTAWPRHSLLTCSPVRAHLGPVPSAAVRKAAARTGACVDRAVSALGRHLGAELPDHVGSLRVTFGGPARLFPQWPPHFTSPAPTRQRGRVPVLHVLVSTCCHLFGSGSSRGCGRASQQGCDCVSLMTEDSEHLSVRLQAILVCSLEKCLFRSVAHF